MAILDDRPVWALSGEDILNQLDALHVELSRLQARRWELIAGLEQLGYAKEIGATDTVQLLALRHRLDPMAVRRDVKVANALPKYARVSAALPECSASITSVTANDLSNLHDLDEQSTDNTNPGRDSGLTDQTDVGASTSDHDESTVILHPGQAEAIVSALEQIPARALVPVEDLLAVEAEMVAAARHASPRGLRKLGARVRDLLDADGPEPEEEKAAAAQALWTTASGKGVRFGGFLANENAELFRTLIEAGARPQKTPQGKLDPRSRTQRQGDALVTVLHAAAANGGGMPAHGGIKPHIAVTIGLDELRAAGAKATGEVTFGEGLSAAAVRRLACDAGIIPIVLGSESEPLDVGREQRYVTPAIRRALIARDGGCVIPGCGAPPGQCDAHHVVHWADGGDTAVGTCALVCKPHHRAIHRDEWQVEIEDGTVRVVRPHWAEPPPIERILRVGGVGGVGGVGVRDPDVGSPPVRIGGTASRSGEMNDESRRSAADQCFWPWKGDPAPLTPEEAARLAPWGNDERRSRAAADHNRRERGKEGGASSEPRFGVDDNRSPSERARHEQPAGNFAGSPPLILALPGQPPGDASLVDASLGVATPGDASLSVAMPGHAPRRVALHGHAPLGVELLHFAPSSGARSSGARSGDEAPGDPQLGEAGSPVELWLGGD